MSSVLSSEDIREVLQPYLDTFGGVNDTYLKIRALLEGPRHPITDKLYRDLKGVGEALKEL